MAALSTILVDSRQGKQQQEQQQDVLWAVLHLAAGRQLKAAAALAASVGDVRLASLLASVNTAAHGRHGHLLLQQITVSHIQNSWTNSVLHVSADVLGERKS